MREGADTYNFSRIYYIFSLCLSYIDGQNILFYRTNRKTDPHAKGPFFYAPVTTLVGCSESRDTRSALSYKPSTFIGAMGLRYISHMILHQNNSYIKSRRYVDGDFSENLFAHDSWSNECR